MSDNTKKYDLVIGSLLHNIGKILYDDYKSSYNNFDIYKDLDIQNEDILDCIKYQTYNQIKDSKLDSKSIAFISFVANNIVSGINGIDIKNSIDENFDKNIPLYSIFNILNGNNESKFYNRQILNEKSDINYPTTQKKEDYKEFYNSISSNIRQIIKKIQSNKNYTNLLFSTLESNLSYIPASTSQENLNDISFYDNIKMISAISSCIFEYLNKNNISNYREFLIENIDDFFEKETFLLYSLDVSGIQSFIYNISSKGALKALRARSFYLEIMMEHIVDEFLDRLNLTRANLLYAGGGHSYMILPNTKETIKLLEELEQSVNNWFIDEFGISLYIAGGYKPCSANVLQNIPDGSYSDLFKEVSKQISYKKGNRYSYKDIIRLNTYNTKEEDGKRECSMCRKIDKLDSQNLCTTCSGLDHIANDILNDKYFIILSYDKYKTATMREPTSKETLKLPFNSYLLSCKTKKEINDLKEKFKQISDSNEDIKVYIKNEFPTDDITSKIFIGDYRPKTDDKYLKNPTLEELAKKSEGIERIAVLRADVDNLGTAFVSGFDNSKIKSNLARTATLSRQLSLFFKYHMNDILSNGSCDILGETKSRNIVVVYSGGDDMFLVGAWNDVIQAGIDIKNALEKFSQGRLTISAGIGVYDSKYPINIMAKEVAILEDISKKHEKVCEDGEIKLKEAVTLFDYTNSYKWSDLEKYVLDEKLIEIKTFFENMPDKGNSLLYNLLELLRNADEKINIARFVYLLSRLEPKKNNKDYDELIKVYRDFAKKMYNWVDDDIKNKKIEHIKQLITAIYLYVYLTREKSDKQGGKEDELSK